MPPASGAGTTLGEHDSLGSKGQATGLSLVWVFPETERAPVDLSWDGAQARARELSFGRDPTCDVCIASKQVSRRHAIVTHSTEPAPAALVRTHITDLESRNGTRVNGRRVATADLERGDIIRLGGWVGVVTDTASRFEELAPGLFGGATLKAALAPLNDRARGSAPVAIEGETGAGKKTVARSLHAWSGRQGPFVVVDCNALPASRAEADLFAALHSAIGGTLMLDQVASLPLVLQTKLLDAPDVCIVVTAVEPLSGFVREGSFHPDLLARISEAGVTVRLPPLRQRREDIAGIFLQLMKSLAERPRDLEVSPDLIEKLCLHTWPFNVRELVGLTRRLLASYASEPLLTEKHLPERFSAVATDPFPADERKTT